MSPSDQPSITVVGLGPAGPDLTPAAAREALAASDAPFLRTGVHPAAAPFADVSTFDHHYEEAETFEEVYRRIVGDLVAAALGGRRVVYAVPGSPFVAEHTVELLRADPRVTVRTIPALSFLDLAWGRLGVDPLAVGVRLVDGSRFAVEAAAERGPMLVAQCWSHQVLSDVKLSLDADVDQLPPVTVLHHLGLDDEQVMEIPWDELDRAFAPDHLTSLWIPRLAAPVGAALVELDGLVRRLRQDCPWDREQTHASLTRHLLEESYEVIDAIDELERPGSGDPVAHLEEELGDLLFQVYFHALLATEEGWFTLADVARGVHDKLVARHPHVFGDLEVADAGAVVANWEEIKKAEKGRASVTDGIPTALPALALAAKLARKSEAVDAFELPSTAMQRSRVEVGLDSLLAPSAAAEDAAQHLGELLFALADIGRRLGVDPEDALRSASLRFRDDLRRAELADRDDSPN